MLGEVEKHIVYNAKLVAFAQRYGFAPRACKAYRAKTKGKVERPCRYIRQDFFLARRFQNLTDLNRQLRNLLDTVANARVHGTTRRVVMQHFREERPALQVLPAGVFNGDIRLDRRVSHEGLVSVGGNYYSVPDRTRRRMLDVHNLAHEIRIYEDGELLAVHPVLEGRRRPSLLPGHRNAGQRSQQAARDISSGTTGVARRPLSFYDQVAWRLEDSGNGWPKQASNRRSVAGATVMTTPWLKRSTACTRYPFDFCAIFRLARARPGEALRFGPI